MRALCVGYCYPSGQYWLNFIAPDNPTGTYHLRFQGRADVSLLWNTGTVQSVAYNANTNTSTATIIISEHIGAGGLIFWNTQRNANSAVGSGITDVHLFRPGYPSDGSVIFTTEWVTFVSHFNVFRFMDWGATNINPVRSWAQRQSPNKGILRNVPVDGRAGERGVAIEYMVALCNEANSDMWINIPVRADSQYAANAIKAILNGSDGDEPYESPTANPRFAPLEPNLKVYIEYGNELWNSALGFMNGHG